jgi:predicted Fe-Mo cluster-binding NifX family protein
MVHYCVDGVTYTLSPGDSLAFQAHLPHSWSNPGPVPAQVLLVLIPADERDVPGGRHFSSNLIKKELTLKIAVITDDGTTISQHFGRAAYYQVLTIEEGRIVNRDLRPKLGHAHFSTQPEAHHHGPDHGHDPASHQRHVGMAEAIADCQFVLCGGMGRGAYESLRRLNIQPVVTDLRDVDEAARAFIDGQLVDHTELLH